MSNIYFNWEIWLISFLPSESVFLYLKTDSIGRFHSHPMGIGTFQKVGVMLKKYLPWSINK